MTKTKKQRPKDINQLAKSIVDDATKPYEDETKPAKVRKLKPMKK